MKNRCALFYYLPIIVFSTFIVTPVHAGSVNLCSADWDSIPVVVISWGINAPDNPSGSITLQNVAKGWCSGPKPDRLCYDRSSNPSDPNSGMRGWDCVSQINEGVFEFELR